MKILTIFRKGLEYAVLVDDEDFNEVSKYRWHITTKGYVRMNVPQSLRTHFTKTTLPLHQFILGCVEGFEIDHINRNKLDNRRKNLRHVTAKENCANRKERKNIASGGLRGVTARPNGRYQAVIRIKNKTLTLGTYNSPEEAHQAYLKAKESQ